MNSTVKITQAAKDDIRQIYESITNQLCAEQSALELLKRFEIAIVSLANFPE